jgi:hypothetical protein
MPWYDPRSWGSNEKVDIDPNAGALPNANWLETAARGQFNRAQNREAPQAGRTVLSGQLDPRQQAQFRAQQMALADRLQGIATGQQMGAGELATMRQGNRALAQQQAFARMGRGGNAAIAARGAARNAGEIGVNVAGQAQQAALGDQASANAQLGSVLGQGREQDLGLQRMKQDAVFQQAGLDQATSLANMQARLQQTGMNDQAAQAYLAQLYGISVSEMNGLLAREQLRQGNYQDGYLGHLFDKAVDAGAKAAGSAATGSDRTLKKDTRKVSRQVDDLLDRLEPWAYKYKDEKWGEGRRAGIMAQDMLKSEMGRRIVRKTDEGLVLDNNAAISGALASVARLNQRLREIEGKGK